MSPASPSWLRHRPRSCSTELELQLGFELGSELDLDLKLDLEPPCSIGSSAVSTITTGNAAITLYKAPVACRNALDATAVIGHGPCRVLALTSTRM